MPKKRNEQKKNKQQTNTRGRLNFAVKTPDNPQQTVFSWQKQFVTQYHRTNPRFFEVFQERPIDKNCTLLNQKISSNFQSWVLLNLGSKTKANMHIFFKKKTALIRLLAFRFNVICFVMRNCLFKNYDVY